MSEPELVWVDKLGWPVEFIEGKPITNFVRWMLHAKRRAWWFQVHGGIQPCVMFEQPDGSWKPGTYDPRPATAYPSHTMSAFTVGNASGPRARDPSETLPSDENTIPGPPIEGERR